MNLIIQNLLRLLGWQKLLMMIWSAILPAVKKAAAKTSTKFDDQVVEILDVLITSLCTDQGAAAAIAEAQKSLKSAKAA